MSTGTCSVCGAEEMELNEDEMCADCAANDGAEFESDDDETDMDFAEDAE